MDTRDYGKQLRWSPVTYEEMLAFFGLVILMGLRRSRSVRDYWAMRLDRMAIYSETMSRDRFLQIMSSLHLNDRVNTTAYTDPSHDQLIKIRPVYDYLKKQFPKHFYPGQYLSIDEMMVGTQARVSFLQYLP